VIDEGYVKFHCDWNPAPALRADCIADLSAWRNRLYDAGLIGFDAEHRVGFGNVSARDRDPRCFIVSGTQTGHIARIGRGHYARVTGWDIDANRVSCEGPVQASSESLTHAALYTLDAAIGAVIHVHSRRLWEAFVDRLPTTSRSATYGTPEMAAAFVRLYHDTAFAADGVAVMGGHRDGIVSFGDTIESAALRLLDLRS